MCLNTGKLQCLQHTGIPMPALTSKYRKKCIQWLKVPPTTIPFRSLRHVRPIMKIIWWFVHSFLYIFFMNETWEHVSVKRQQIKCQLWPNCFLCWMLAGNLRPPTRETHILHPLMWAVCLTTQPWPIHQKRIGTNRTDQHTAHDNELIRARKLTIGLLGCLHLTLAHR